MKITACLMAAVMGALAGYAAAQNANQIVNSVLSTDLIQIQRGNSGAIFYATPATIAGGGSGGITPGTTTCTTCTANNLIYTNGTLVEQLATASSGVLVTSAGGVPSVSTTLPSGLTIPGYALTGVHAPISVPIRTVTASGNITVSATTDYFICVNLTTPAAIAVNLPPTPGTGLTFLIKDCSGTAATDNLTITPTAGNIDGATTYVMSTNYASVGVTYNGVSWSVN